MKFDYKTLLLYLPVHFIDTLLRFTPCPSSMVYSSSSSSSSIRSRSESSPTRSTRSSSPLSEASSFLHGPHYPSTYISLKETDLDPSSLAYLFGKFTTDAGTSQLGLIVHDASAEPPADHQDEVWKCSDTTNIFNPLSTTAVSSNTLVSGAL